MKNKKKAEHYYNVPPFLTLTLSSLSRDWVYCAVFLLLCESWINVTVFSLLLVVSSRQCSAIVHEAIESILLATKQLPETAIGITTCILY